MLPGVQKAQGDPNMVPSAKGSKNSFTERLKKISTFEAFLFCLFDFDIVLNPVLLAAASGNGLVQGGHLYQLGSHISH